MFPWRGPRQWVWWPDPATCNSSKPKVIATILYLHFFPRCTSSFHDLTTHLYPSSLAHHRSPPAKSLYHLKSTAPVMAIEILRTLNRPTLLPRRRFSLALHNHQQISQNRERKGNRSRAERNYPRKFNKGMSQTFYLPRNHSNPSGQDMTYSLVARNCLCRPIANLDCVKRERG